MGMQPFTAYSHQLDQSGGPPTPAMEFKKAPSAVVTKGKPSAWAAIYSAPSGLACTQLITAPSLSVTVRLFRQARYKWCKTSKEVSSNVCW